MLYAAAILVLISLIIFWQVYRGRKAMGIPAGRVIYADTRLWGRVEQALYDPELGLVGRPDYLVEQAGKVTPVEVKTNPVSDAPYDAHIYQLAAYCLLVERNSGKQVSSGILHYPNRTFEIDYTPALRRTLLELLDQMRVDERRRSLPRSHNSPARCSGCGFRAVCDQRLL